MAFVMDNDCFWDIVGVTEMIPSSPSIRRARPPDAFFDLIPTATVFHEDPLVAFVGVGCAQGVGDVDRFAKGFHCAWQRPWK